MAVNEEIKSQVDDFLGENPEQMKLWDDPEELSTDVDITKPPVEEGDESEDGASPGDGDPRGTKEEGAPVEAPKKEEPPVETAPQVTAPQGNAELEALKSQNAQLAQQLQALQTTIESLKVAPPTGAAPQLSEGQIVDLIGDEDIDEILSSKDKVNSLLSKVMAMTLQAAQQGVHKQLPTIVQQQVETQRTVKGIVDEFYTVNKDLAPVKKVVAAAANEVAAAHPDWDVARVLQETAVTVRKSLGLGEPPAVTAPVGNPQVPQKPALPGKNTGGQRGGGTGLTAVQKEILDIL